MHTKGHYYEVRGHERLRDNHTCLKSHTKDCNSSWCLAEGILPFNRQWYIPLKLRVKSFQCQLLYAARQADDRNKTETSWTCMVQKHLLLTQLLSGNHQMIWANSMKYKYLSPHYVF